MKKLLSVLLSAVMIITSLFALPSVAMAATGSCGAKAKYTYDLTKGTLVISGSGAMSDYSADAKAPWNNADCIGKTRSITISSGITAIGACAFQQMTQVEQITISDTVKQIGDRAFDGCAVGAIPMTLSIPSSVEKIGVKAFRGMSKLTAFSVSESNKYYKSVDGVLYDKNCSTLIQVPSRLDKTELTLPETVTTISTDAFYKVYNVTDLYVPAGVNTVGDGITSVFKNSSITVHYPENSAFDWNIYLKNNGISGVCYNQAACMHDISGYTEEIIKPTCTERGYTLHTCSECGFSYKDSYTDIINHNYKDVVDPASLTKNGKVTSVCDACGVKNRTTVIYAPKTFALSTTTYAYNGKVKTPAVTVKDSKGRTLKKNTDYTVTYQSGRIKIGKYKVTVKLKGNYSGTKYLYFTISPRISLSGTNYTYNGKVKTPAVTVKDGNGNRISTKYYTVAYASGRKNVGKYKVTIKFRNGHSGTYTKYFTIKPTATSISSVSPTKRAFTVRWRKKTAQVTGYQIQYSVKSNFSTYKTVRITKNSTTSRKISKLASKRRYYVRVRTYKTVGKTTYYSDWSSKKAVVTK